jgi:hypothetical protein
LCRLLFGGEVLRHDGLFGVILPSFILLMKKLANELLGALRDVRERGALRIGGNRRSVVTLREKMKKLKIDVKQKHGNPRWKGRTYSKWQRIAGGASEGPSSERLKPAIATEKPRVFYWRREKGDAVANEGLLLMPGRR